MLKRAHLPALFAGDTRGTSAVEFSLVSLPFFALLCGIIQIAFIIWAGQNLDYMLQNAARLVFTGTFQKTYPGITDPAYLLSQLRGSLCGGGPSVFNCSALKLDLVLGNSFAGSTPTSPINPATKDWASNFGTNYTCAAPGQIVVIRAAVKFPVFFGFMASGLQNFADGSKLLQSTVVFRTEPYGSGC